MKVLILRLLLLWWIHTNLILNLIKIYECSRDIAKFARFGDMIKILLLLLSTQKVSYRYVCMLAPHSSLQKHIFVLSIIKNLWWIFWEKLLSGFGHHRGSTGFLAKFNFCCRSTGWELYRRMETAVEKLLKFLHYLPGSIDKSGEGRPGLPQTF